MEQNNMKLPAKIEALLFVYGEAMKMKRIAELLSISEEEAKTGVDELKQILSSEERGVTILASADTVMLATKPELGEIVKALVSEELDSELSPASLETLSIIAYLGPISRAEIDYIRGVNSSFIIRNLQIRGLIAKDASGKNAVAPSYSATFDFLKHIGINSVEELPEFNKYREVVAKFKSGGEAAEIHEDKS